MGVRQWQFGITKGETGAAAEVWVREHVLCAFHLSSNIMPTSIWMSKVCANLQEEVVPPSVEVKRCGCTFMSQSHHSNILRLSIPFLVSLSSHLLPDAIASSHDLVEDA